LNAAGAALLWHHNWEQVPDVKLIVELYVSVPATAPGT